MNASTKAAYLAPADDCVLIGSSYELTETISLDLYGEFPTSDDEHYLITKITTHGAGINGMDLIEMFDPGRLDFMAKALTFKDDTDPNKRRYAADCKHKAACLF